MALYLINHGADVDPDGLVGRPLGSAARWRQEAVVRLLLEKGADVNAGGGALHSAARGGSASIVSMLIGAGAHVNTISRASGYTPLNEAAEKAMGLQLTETMRLLLDAGATANVVTKREAVTGKTIGVYASYLKEKGRNDEARAAYANAKGYLERALKEAESELIEASGHSWFEPSRPSGGGIIGTGTEMGMDITRLLFSGGRGSSDYRGQIIARVVILKACVAECVSNLGGTDSKEP